MGLAPGSFSSAISFRSTKQRHPASDGRPNRDRPHYDYLGDNIFGDDLGDRIDHILRASVLAWSCRGGVLSWDYPVSHLLVSGRAARPDHRALHDRRSFIRRDRQSPFRLDHAKFRRRLRVGRLQWLFLLEGLPSVLLGLCVLAYLDDDIVGATWLTAGEKRVLVEAIARDAGQKQADSIVKALLDHGFG